MGLCVVSTLFKLFFFFWCTLSVFQTRELHGEWRKRVACDIRL